MEATERPWRAEGPDEFGDYNILHEKDALAVAAVVSNMRLPGEVAANAALIVTAVNQHAALMRCAEALREVIAATQAYLPPDGTSAKDCISAILAATDNPEINAALTALEKDNG